MVSLEGVWQMGSTLPDERPVLEGLAESENVHRVCFDADGLLDWDSMLLTFLVKIIDFCHEADIAVDRSKLPQGVQRLLDLAYAVPERDEADHDRADGPWLARAGERVFGILQGGRDALAFIGEAVVSFVRFLLGRARYRRSDLAVIIHETGPAALPIVSLISVLVGLILAFVGAVQLHMFGAELYVANLVGLGMAREMGAMMTAIIMAGRTGAAFAAQLGSMQVNGEIDALRTLGIPPIDFLVLPRMLALVLMLPLLCLYADFMGIFGGLLVAWAMMDISILEYINQTKAALTLSDFATGVFKSLVFGFVVAVAGCMRGMQSGSSSAAVGRAATSAVVTGMVLIVVADAILTVLFDVLGF